ncbi:hypothetical protein C8K36_102542 [Rhodococcus sp. OK519]|nr:hypothetical protein C8K36_102542 [Rhodococcus sp. OK519]
MAVLLLGGLVQMRYFLYAPTYLFAAVGTVSAGCLSDRSG